jgi:CheY-like chemotaxis protein
MPEFLSMKKKLRSVFLIDDDTPTNYLHRLILNEIDCTENILVFQSTELALHFIAYDRLFDYAGQEAENLILLDINMPRMDGWEFLAAWQRLPEGRKKMFVVIVLTTSLNPDDEVTASQIEQLKGFYIKPLSRLKLEEMLKLNFPAFI